MHIEEVGPLKNGQAGKPRKRGRGRPPSDRTSGDGKKQSQTGTVQFVNTTHPDETTNANSLRLIRSHTAKHWRALQREKKEPQFAKPSSYSEEHAELGLMAYDDETEDSYANSYENDETRSTYSPQTRGGIKPRGRKLAPKRQTVLLLPKHSGQPQRRSPSPIQLIGGARQDAYHGFARALSKDEQYLFDYYLNYVILYGYESCHHKEDKTVFQKAMREVSVPFAMAQASLMPAIFHVACRNYAANTNNSYSKKVAVKKLQYRIECLNIATQAIASQTVATDSTIFLALILASESFFEGEIDAFVAHGMGIIKMVSARGGLDTLGMSGFLTKVVEWSIFNPKNLLISGPDETGFKG